MKVKAPAEDPAEKAARLAESTRADAALTSSTQDLLDEEDRARLRRLGALPNQAGSAGGAGTLPLTFGAMGVPPAGLMAAGGTGGATASGGGGGGGGIQTSQSKLN